MTIEEFVARAKKQDPRNTFKTYDGDVSKIPLEIKDFYIKANPIDVEVESRKLGNIHFFPLEKIYDVRKDYSFMPEDSFIFASNNSDPIFIVNSLFYITYESQYNPEFLSDNFESFLDILRIR